MWVDLAVAPICQLRIQSLFDKKQASIVLLVVNLEQTSLQIWWWLDEDLSLRISKMKMKLSFSVSQNFKISCLDQTSRFLYFL